MSDQWYCRVRGKEQGPLSARQLQALAQQGALAPNHLVRQGADGQWVSASRINGLFRGGIKAPETTPGPEPELERPKPPVLKAAPPAKSASLDAVAPLVSAETAHCHNDTVGEADSQPPEKSVIGNLILAMGVGIIGLCLYRFPILGALIGLATSIVCFRTLLSAIHRDRFSKIMAIATMAVALIALGAGALTTIKSDDPVGDLRKKLGVESDQPQAARRDLINAAQEKASESGVYVSIPEAFTGPLSSVSKSREASMVENPDDGYLFLQVRLENEKGEDPVEFQRWSDAIRQQRGVPKLIDGQGNEYAAVSFGELRLPGQPGPSNLHRFETLTDLLVFKKPVDGFEYLELTLSASALGGEGQMRFEIPKSMVVQVATTSLPPDKLSTPGDARKPHNPLETIEIKREPEDDVSDG
jgi:hypothetical protein